MMDDQTRLKLVTLVVLGVIIVVSVIALAVVAIFTPRDLAGAERLVFGAVILMSLIGGLTIYVDRVRVTRRRREDEDDPPDPDC